MRLALLAPGLGALALGLAGCGSSGSSSRHSVVPVGAPLHVYRVDLTGQAEIPPGAAGGSGAAVIAVHRRSVVCWRFVHLRGFTMATVAHIHTGTKNQSGSIVVALSKGARLRHRGCVRAKAATVAAIEGQPSAYYVNIHSARYPAGAVRGQL